MKRTGLVIAISIFSTASAVHLYAQKVQLKDLPPAVKATVEAETKNATLKGLSKEKENGKVVYELESLVNGRTRDLMIDSAGKVYVVEEQLDVEKAPAPVKKMSMELDAAGSPIKK